MTPKEMDRKAAKVMGWREGKYLNTFDDENTTRSAWFDSKGGLKRFYSDWSPTTNIADAWVLVEWMVAQDWYVSIDNENRTAWMAEFVLPGQTHREYGPTAWFAITKAFLRANGVEV